MYYSPGKHRAAGVNAGWRFAYPAYNFTGPTDQIL